MKWFTDLFQNNSLFNRLAKAAGPPKPKKPKKSKEKSEQEGGVTAFLNWMDGKLPTMEQVTGAPEALGRKIDEGVKGMQSMANAGVQKAKQAASMAEHAAKFPQRVAKVVEEGRSFMHKLGEVATAFKGLIATIGAFFVSLWGMLTSFFGGGGSEADTPTVHFDQFEKQEPTYDPRRTNVEPRIVEVDDKMGKGIEMVGLDSEELRSLKI